MSDDGIEEQESIRAQEARDNVGGSLNPTQLPSLDQGRGIQPPPKIDIKEHEAKTARTLTLTLVWVLVGVFVVHYSLLAYLGINFPQVVPNLEHVFNTAFPVFSGLVGTAVGFYLKERK
jgi:hypothetical protein